MTNFLVIWDYREDWEEWEALMMIFFQVEMTFKAYKAFIILALWEDSRVEVVTLNLFKLQLSIGI